MADLTAEAASIALDRAKSEWWLAFTNRDYERAASLATDVAAYARSLRQATFEIFDQEGRKNANPASQGIGGNSTGESTAKGD